MKKSKRKKIVSGEKRQRYVAGKERGSIGVKERVCVLPTLAVLMGSTIYVVSWVSPASHDDLLSVLTLYRQFWLFRASCHPLLTVLTVSRAFWLSTDSSDSLPPVLTIYYQFWFYNASCDILPQVQHEFLQRVYPLYSDVFSEREGSSSVSSVFVLFYWP